MAVWKGVHASVWVCACLCVCTPVSVEPIAHGKLCICKLPPSLMELQDCTLNKLKEH